MDRDYKVYLKYYLLSWNFVPLFICLISSSNTRTNITHSFSSPYSTMRRVFGNCMVYLFRLQKKILKPFWTVMLVILLVLYLKIKSLYLLVCCCCGCVFNPPNASAVPKPVPNPELVPVVVPKPVPNPKVLFCVPPNNPLNKELELLGLR